MLWAARDVTAVDWESLSPVVGRGGVQILLLGLGAATVIVDGKLRARLREAGIALEAMDTSAACRTYNVLAAEDRRVAAIEARGEYLLLPRPGREDPPPQVGY